MRIDVTIAAKNSERTLDRCLKAIRASIPVRRIVVVDNGSTDGTVDVARRNGAEVVNERGLLGRVRYQQALNCSTEWIAIIDSDVYLYDSWWPSVSKYLNQSNVGMVLGIGDYPTGELSVYLAYLINRMKRHGAEAFSNSLVRRDYVLSCRELLGNVPIGEDGVFASHLRRNRKKIVTIPVPLHYHDSPTWKNTLGAYFRWGRGIRISRGPRGLKPLAKILRDNIRDYIFFVVDTHRVSLSLLFFIIYLWFVLFVGYISVTK